MKNNRKIILPALMFLSILIICLGLGIIVYISYLGLKEISPVLPVIFFGIYLLLILWAVLILINTFLIISPMARFSFWQKNVYKAINLLFPLIVLLGKVFSISRRRIENSFVHINNRLIGIRKMRVLPKDLLVISPHCLQLASCKNKITYDVNNCQRCGGCTVGAMLTMAKKLGFNFAVVTGGTLARRLVKQVRPKLILAIACERDLASGIADVYPLPAVGVLNIRPFGPCYNTTVDIDEVRKMIEKYIIEEK